MNKPLFSNLIRRREKEPSRTPGRLACLTLALLIFIGSGVLLSAPAVSAADGVTHYIDSDLNIKNGKVIHPSRAVSGETVTVTAQPDTLCMTASLTVLMRDEEDFTKYTREVPGIVHPDPNTIVFTMPDSDVMVVASFGDYDQQRVFIRDMEGGTVVSDKNLVRNRETVTLTVKPDNGYVLVPGSLKIVEVELDTGYEREYPEYSIETLKEGEQFSFKVLSFGCVCVGAEFTKLSEEPLYRVDSVGNAKNGTIAVDHEWASAGWTVTVTAKPDASRGYATKSLTVTDQYGSPVEISVAGNDTYAFIMPEGDVFVLAEFDVPVYKITVDSADAGVSSGRRTGCRVDVVGEEEAGTSVHPVLLLPVGTEVAELTVTGDLTGKTVPCGLSEHTDGSTSYFYSFTMPDEPVTLRARFGFIRHSLDVGEAFEGEITAAACGETNISLPCSVSSGEEVVLTYNPPEHYKTNGIRVRYNREDGSPLTLRIPVFPQKDGSYNAVFTMPDSDAALVTELVAEISTWSALQAAIDGAKEGGTVTLYGDIRSNAKDPCLRIKAGTDVVLDLNGYTLDRNLATAVENGCVILIEGGATLTVADSSANGAGKITGGRSVNGGGVYCAGTLIFQGGTITGNRATANGGGIFVDGGIATMTGGVISGNRCEADGGGLYARHGAKNIFTVSLSDCVIEKNTAAENGGGISCAGYGGLTLTGVTVRNNSAKSGGGVSLREAFAQIENSDISDNSAESLCGGLYVFSVAHCSVTSSHINKNGSAQKAGGIAVALGGRLQLTDCEVSENKAPGDGGGVFISENTGNFEADGCAFTSNEAGYGGAFYILAGQEVYVRDSRIAENRSLTNGGAFWMGDHADTKADIMSCEILQNEAARNGGVAYARGRGKLLLTDCVIKQNNAKTGTGGVLFPNGKGLTLGLVDTEVSENRASSCGGIYTKGSLISMKGLVVIRDNVGSGEGNNLVLAEGSYVANPGLYAGSYVSVYTTGDLLAREISEYQMRYFKIDNRINGSVPGKIFGVNKTVEAPIFASLFGTASIPVVTGLAALGAAGVAAAAIIKKKKGGKAENERDDESGDENDDE